MDSTLCAPAATQLPCADSSSPPSQPPAPNGTTIVGPRAKGRGRRGGRGRRRCTAANATADSPTGPAGARDRSVSASSQRSASTDGVRERHADARALLAGATESAALTPLDQSPSPLRVADSGAARRAASTQDAPGGRRGVNLVINPADLCALDGSHHGSGGLFAVSPSGSAATAAGSNSSRTNLFVRHLPAAVDEEALAEIFSLFGRITSHAVMRNIHTGESLGTAFVRYETHEQARQAMQLLAPGDGLAAACAAYADKGSTAPGGGAAGRRSGGGGPAAARDRATAPPPPSSLPQGIAVEFAQKVYTTINRIRERLLRGGGGGGNGDSRDICGIVVQWARKTHDAAPAGADRHRLKKLFVRNIPIADATADRLMAVFAAYGTVKSISVHRDTLAADKVAAVHAEQQPRPAGGLDGSRGDAFHDTEDEGLLSTTTMTAPNGANDRRRIAFITYDEEGAAEKAAAAVHNTKPFAGCLGVPLMVKLAEDVPLKHAQTAAAAAAAAAAVGAGGLSPYHSLGGPHGGNGAAAPLSVVVGGGPSGARRTPLHGTPLHGTPLTASLNNTFSSSPVMGRVDGGALGGATMLPVSLRSPDGLSGGGRSGGSPAFFYASPFSTDVSLLSSATNAALMGSGSTAVPPLGLSCASLNATATTLGSASSSPPGVRSAAVPSPRFFSQSLSSLPPMAGAARGPFGYSTGPMNETFDTAGGAAAMTTSTALGSTLNSSASFTGAAAGPVPVRWGGGSHTERAPSGADCDFAATFPSPAASNYFFLPPGTTPVAERQAAAQPTYAHLSATTGSLAGGAAQDANGAWTLPSGTPVAMLPGAGYVYYGGPAIGWVPAAARAAAVHAQSSTPRASPSPATGAAAAAAAAATANANAAGPRVLAGAPPRTAADRPMTVGAAPRSTAWSLRAQDEREREAEAARERSSRNAVSGNDALSQFSQFIEYLQLQQRGGPAPGAAAAADSLASSLAPAGQLSHSVSLRGQDGWPATAHRRNGTGGASSEEAADSARDSSRSSSRWRHSAAVGGRAAAVRDGVEADTESADSVARERYAEDDDDVASDGGSDGRGLSGSLYPPHHRRGNGPLAHDATGYFVDALGVSAASAQAGATCVGADATDHSTQALTATMASLSEGLQSPTLFGAQYYSSSSPTLNRSNSSSPFNGLSAAVGLPGGSAGASSGASGASGATAPTTNVYAFGNLYGYPSDASESNGSDRACEINLSSFTQPKALRGTRSAPVLLSAEEATNDPCATIASEEVAAMDVMNNTRDDDDDEGELDTEKVLRLLSVVQDTAAS